MKAWRVKTICQWLAACCIGFSAASAVAAAPDDYPTRPVKLVVPFAPGALNDAIGRLLATHLGEALGQPVVVENRPGAGGQIGVASIKTQPADGYTLVLASVDSLAMGPAMKKQRMYEPLTDFTPVAMIGSSPLVVVTSPRFAVTSLSDLLAQAKSRPNGVSYGSAGIGTSLHLGVELLQARSGTSMLHVPYQGGAPVVQALMANQIDFALLSPELASRNRQSGRVGVVAQAGTKRHPLLPDVPTAIEQGMPDVVLTPWFGLLAPAHLPGPVLARLEGAVSRVAQNPAFVQQLVQIGAQVDYRNAAQFRAYMSGEAARWTKVIQDARIPLQE